MKTQKNSTATIIPTLQLSNIQQNKQLKVTSFLLDSDSHD